MTEEHRRMKAMRRSVDELSFTCPTCQARVGEYCTTGKDNPHKRRLGKVPPTPRRNDVGSVYAIPTHFESNRRRH